MDIYYRWTEIMTYSESANHTESKNMSIMSVCVWLREGVLFWTQIVVIHITRLFRCAPLPNSPLFRSYGLKPQQSFFLLVFFLILFFYYISSFGYLVHEWSVHSSILFVLGLTILSSMYQSILFYNTLQLIVLKRFIIQNVLAGADLHLNVECLTCAPYTGGGGQKGNQNSCMAWQVIHKENILSSRAYSDTAGAIPMDSVFHPLSPLLT